MELHESLAQLARDHGESLFTEADAFRGALDDYLDEGSASTGTINLLTDAVRLGALQGMLTMLESGASVEDAVESAGQRLSRDRGSADVAGSQWACAVLGYALGKVPVSLATRLRPDAYTAEPPSGSSGSGTAARPAVSPSHAPSPPTEVSAPQQQAPIQNWPPPSAPGAQGAPSAPAVQQQPSQQYGAPAAAYAYTASPGYGTPPPKKSSSGLIIGAIVAVVILGVVAIIAIVALSGGDAPTAKDDTSETSGPTDTGDTGGTSGTTDPALTLQGSGYTYQFPNSDWKDLTADTPDTSGTIDTIAAPGDNIGTARGNILVETSSAFGETDVDNLKDDWKNVLESSTGGTPVDIAPRTIGGKEAVGVEIKWTNANDFDVHQIAFLVISGDEQYSITGSFAQGDSGFQDTFYSVLDTWVWEE